MKLSPYAKSELFCEKVIWEHNLIFHNFIQKKKKVAKIKITKK